MVPLATNGTIGKISNGTIGRIPNARIDGYSSISNCRPEQPSRLRGGVATFMKKIIKADIKIIDSSLNDMIWIKLARIFSNLGKIYIYVKFIFHLHPERTNIDKKLFQKLEYDIVKFTPVNFVMIMGDINAHVNCNDLDFIINEESDVMEDSIPAIYIIIQMTICTC